MGRLAGYGAIVLVPIIIFALGGFVQWILGIVVAARDPAKHVAEVIAAILFGPFYITVRGFMASACAFKKGGCPKF